MAETDMTLLGRYAANRDAEAFAELIRRYAGMVYGTCLRVLGSEADAEDVTQDCFLELARTAGKVRGAGDSAAGFIHALARSRAVDFLKQASRRRQRERAAGRQQRAGSEWAQIEPLVDAAMADLPEEQRELLVLHFLRGVTQADMAQAAGVDQSTISRRLTRAVELLREHLAKQGVEVSAGALGAAMADHILRDVPARVQQSLAKMALAGMGKAAGVGIGAKLAITAVVAAAVGATVAQHGSATQATPVAVSAPATTQAATTQTAGMPEAAELFRAFQGAQLWINKVRSLDVELEVVWTKPEGKEMKRQPPGRQRWAFDDHRVYCLHDGEVRPDMYDLRVWDGKRLICRSNTYADPEYCTYDTAPQKYFTYNASLLWLQYARHPFWFWPGQPESGSQLGKPDDWEVIAREPFHGVDCYVIEQIHVQQCMRLYVGVADLRQYGFSSRQAPEELKEKFIDVARNLAAEDGKVLNSLEEIRQWFQRLPATKQKALDREIGRQLREDMELHSEQWMGDYRELAPGRWAPMTMGYTNRLSNGQRTRCDIKVVRFDIDRPLDDALFTPDLKLTDGVQISDFTHDPPLVYRYKANRTTEEWKQIEAEAKAKTAPAKPMPPP